MNLLKPLFAQDLVPTEVIPGAWHWMGLTFKEVLIMLGAVGLITLILVIWAAYIRKPANQRSSRHYHYPEASKTDSLSSSEENHSENGSEKRYRRKRRRRREHRPRNPTLAETGGLPPLRSERPQDPLP